MGVDIQVLRFLLLSRSTASFESFLMLGRQWCHVSADDLRKELRQSKSAPADIRSAIAEAQQSRFVEPILKWLGARQIESLDFSNYEQATIVQDMLRRSRTASKVSSRAC